MIKNVKQANIARQNLKSMISEKSTYITNQDSSNIIKNQLALDSFDSLICELEQEIQNYENLIANGYHCFKDKTLDDLGEILISSRLAQKITQKELGNLVGIDEQQIQRYETNDYESAALPRLQDIADALNIRLSFEKIEILGSRINFKVPHNVNENDIKEVEEITKQFGTLLMNI